MTGEEACDALTATYQELTAALDAATWEAQLPEGHWRVRDAAAHVAAWDRILADDVRRLNEAQPPAWLSWDDATTDEVNESHVREAADWSVETLRTELHEARSALLDAIGAIGAARFESGPHSGDIVVSPAWLCAYWIAHDRAHIAEIYVTRQAQ